MGFSGEGLGSFDCAGADFSDLVFVEFYSYVENEGRVDWRSVTRREINLFIVL